jgi:tetratricopeptide (TPR) repeat protein
MMYLRLGDYDKSMADYRAALRRDPKEASSLYGLGLAQLHAGNQAEATRHMQEALAIDSQTAERYRKIGLAP